MIVTERHEGQGIRIQNDVLVVVTKIRGSRVKIGIQAPRFVQVNRNEIYQRIRVGKLVPLSVENGIVTHDVTGEEVEVPECIANELAKLLDL